MTRRRRPTASRRAHLPRRTKGPVTPAIGADGRTVLSAGWPAWETPCRSWGMDDARADSGRVVRIPAELRPRRFVGENVPGLYPSPGRDFATVIGDLARLGYGFPAGSGRSALPPAGRRVVIVGRLGDSGRPARTTSRGAGILRRASRRGGLCPTACPAGSFHRLGTATTACAAARRGRTIHSAASTLTCDQARALGSGATPEDDHNIVAQTATPLAIRGEGGTYRTR